MKYVLQIYELNSVRPNLLLVEKAVVRIKTVSRRIHRCVMDSARRAEVEGGRGYSAVSVVSGNMITRRRLRSFRIFLASFCRSVEVIDETVAL